MEYIILIIYAWIVSANYHKKENWKQFLPAYLFLYFYCIILFGLRYRVGIDTLNYMNNYIELPTFSQLNSDNFFQTLQAPGWILLTSICKQISSSFYFLQIIISIFFNTCLFITLKKYSTNPFLTFVFFMFMNGFYFNTEILKESLAVGIFLINLDNLIKKRWKNYYSLVFLSISFHYSAIILLLFPLLHKIKFDSNFIIWLLLIALFDVYFMEFFSSYIPIDALSERYKQYEALELNFNWVFLAFMKSSFLALLILIISKKYKIQMGDFEFILCLSILFSIGSIDFPIIFQRFNNYTCIIIAITFTNILYVKNLGKIVVVILITSYFTIYTYSYYEHKRYRIWYPYYSVFNEKKDSQREALWHEMFPF